jgi:3-hydroxyisobutyrate dehydrogenase-like beta-hydroxyacid dehydrogenase
MKKVSMIGLGNMGGNMAKVLLEVGYETYVYDLDDKKMQQAKTYGAKLLNNQKDACKKTDTIILSLPNDDIMKNVVMSLIEQGVEGKTIIDTTSARYTTTVDMAKIVKQNDGYFLDAPVTGGEVGAAEGTLTFMVGGDQKAYDDQLSLFKAMGEKIAYIGQSGHGQITKMVNQAIMASIYCSVTESFAFAAERGVDIERVHYAIESGGAKSSLLTAMKDTLITGQPKINNNLAIHAKDVDYVMQESNRLKSLMPVNASVQQVMNVARQKGLSDHWSGSIYVMWEELLGKKLNSSIKETK